MSTNPTAQSLLELANLHQLNVKGADILSVQDPTENIVIKRPWIDEPSGAVPFDAQAGINLPAVGAGDVVVLTMMVPQGYDGVIKWISNNVNFGGFVQFSGDIVWRIEADQKPIRNFENILAEKGTIDIPRPVSPIRIYSGQTITYVVNHEANVALNGQVVCSLSGYFYPSRGVS